jgi:O-antigen/teichoic acid export membrane protein
MIEKTSTPLIRIIFKNTLFSTFGSLALKFINFIFNVYVIRRLGDDRYGQYATVLAFVGLFQIFAEFGMTQYVLREVARDHTKTQSLFWDLVAVRFLLAIFSIIGITIGATFMEYSPVLVLGVFMYTCMFLLSAIQSPLEALQTAYERFDIVSLMSISGQMVYVFFGAIFLFSGKSFLWLIVAGFIGLVPPITIGIWATLKNKILRLHPVFSPRSWGRLILAGLPFGISSLTLSITFSADTVILSKFYPSEVVGWYRVAYDLVFTLLFFTRGFKEAITPTLARVHATDPGEIERWYHRAVRVFTLISLPMVVGGMVLAQEIILFLYKAEYLPSAKAFQILAWDIPFVLYAAFCGNITTIIRQEKRAARIFTFNAVFNILANLIIIPRFGYLGASAVTVLTDMISATQFYLFLRKDLHIPNFLFLIIRTLLAAALMGLVVWLVPLDNLFLSAGLGVIIYFLLVFLFRIPDQFERGLIKKGLHRIREVRAS